MRPSFRGILAYLRPALLVAAVLLAGCAEGCPSGSHRPEPQGGGELGAPAARPTEAQPGMRIVIDPATGKPTDEIPPDAPVPPPPTDREGRPDPLKQY